MHFTIMASPSSPHQVQHQAALSEGLSNLGIESTSTNSRSNALIAGEFVAVWGWRQGKIYHDLGKRVLVMERGYIGDRFSYTSLAYDGLNGFGKFPGAKDDNGERFHKAGKMLPWKKDGEYSLILGQVPGDASLRGIDLMPWYEERAKELQAAYGLPVLFRPHPQALKRGIVQSPKGTIRCTSESLEAALDKAYVSVTFNSNSGVDSVLAGVPTICFDKGSMAYDVCGHSVSEIIRPDRNKWAYELAHKQWTIEEIRSGEALKGFING